MRKPQLLHKTPQGATIHSYDLEGGQRTFHRFLGCLEGSCSFYDTYQDALRGISPKILT